MSSEAAIRDHLPVLRRLVELPGDAFSGLVSVTDLLLSATGWGDFFPQAADVSGMGAQEVSNIGTVVIHFIMVSGHERSPVSAIVRSAIDASETGLGESERSILADRLTALAGTAGFRQIYRSTSVAVERESPYLGSRALTDIRPVFGDDPGIVPDVAVIIHTLRIQVASSRGPETLEIACTHGDLADLVETLEHAQQNAVALREFLASAGMPDVGGVE